MEFRFAFKAVPFLALHVTWPVVCFLICVFLPRASAPLPITAGCCVWWFRSTPPLSILLDERPHVNAFRACYFTALDIFKVPAPSVGYTFYRASRSSGRTHRCMHEGLQKNLCSEGWISIIIFLLLFLLWSLLTVSHFSQKESTRLFYRKKTFLFVLLLRSDFTMHWEGQKAERKMAVMFVWLENDLQCWNKIYSFSK